VEVADADIYTTAHVNCLAERREARLISAFFDMAEELKGASENAFPRSRSGSIPAT